MFHRVALVAGVLLLNSTSILLGQETSESNRLEAHQLLERGRALIAKNDLDGAIASLRESVRLYPQGEEACQAIAETLLTRCERDRIDAWLYVMRIKSPVDPDLLESVSLMQRGHVLTGLPWLARHQFPDGHWSADGFSECCKRDGSPSCDGTGHKQSDIYCTSLVLLTFVGAGYTHLSRDVFDGISFGVVVKKAAQWLLRHMDSDGCIGDRGYEQFMLDHALATLAMSEISRSAKSLAAKPDKELSFLLSSRISGKGWSMKGKEGTPDPVATSWGLLALWSARRAGLNPPDDAEREAHAWLDAYVGRSKLRSAEEDTSAVFAFAVDRLLDSASAPDDVQAWCEGILKAPPGKSPDQRDAWLTYAGSLALSGDGPDGKYWKEWCEMIKVSVRKTRRFYDYKMCCQAGSWDPVGPHDSIRGRLLITALYTLTQEICLRYENAICRKQ